MPEKIIYFMDHYPNLGGAANTLLRQAALMKKAGKTVLVVVSSWGNICEEYLKICDEEGIRDYELCYFVTSQPEGVDLFSVLEHYDAVKAFLKEQIPDIVHSVQLNPVVELACRELKIPHIMNIYQIMPEFFSFKYADIFPQYHICDSLFYANVWKKYLGTKSYCVRTVAMEGNRKEYPARTDYLRFVCVGLLCERKNQLEVIRAFELAIKIYGLNGRLQFWGHVMTPYAELCRQYIIDRKLQKNIEINGFTKDIEAVYRDNDVLICGSTSESYPNVVSEALSHGLAVISTPVAGVPEVIKNRENGYLSKGYEAEDIADCIQKAYKDVRTGRLHKILENARITYEAVHSPDAVTLKLLKCYEEVLADYKAEDRYTVDALKTDFSEIICKYYKYMDYFTDHNYVKNYLWKIYYVANTLMKLCEKNNCYIWGTGKYGKLYKEILDVFAPGLTIAGFIDSYAEGQCMGYEIVDPKKVLKQNGNIILVGILTKRKEVFDILDRYGFRYNDSYFIFDPFSW